MLPSLLTHTFLIVYPVLAFDIYVHCYWFCQKWHYISYQTRCIIQLWQQGMHLVLLSECSVQAQKVFLFHTDYNYP